LNELILDEQCGNNLTDRRSFHVSAEQMLLSKLEMEQKRLNELFQKTRDLADPRLLEVSQRLDKIIVKILKLKEMRK